MFGESATDPELTFWLTRITSAFGPERTSPSWRIVSAIGYEAIGSYAAMKDELTPSPCNESYMSVYDAVDGSSTWRTNAIGAIAEGEFKAQQLFLAFCGN